MFLYFTSLIPVRGRHGFPMTAPWLASEEAQDEKAGDDVGVPGDHGNHDGVWGFTHGFGGRLRRRGGPEQLVRLIASSGRLKLR